MFTFFPLSFQFKCKLLKWSSFFLKKNNNRFIHRFIEYLFRFFSAFVPRDQDNGQRIKSMFSHLSFEWSNDLSFIFLLVRRQYLNATLRFMNTNNNNNNNWHYDEWWSSAPIASIIELCLCCVYNEKCYTIYTLTCQWIFAKVIITAPIIKFHPVCIVWRRSVSI